MYKGIIFDLDGTLLDTSKDIQNTINKCLNDVGLEGVSMEKTYELIGNGARSLVERALTGHEELIEEVYANYSECFPNIGNSLTCPFPKEEEFLAECERRGIKTAIVTNKPQKASDNVISQLFPSFRFTCILGNSNAYPLKPAPDSTLLALEKMGLKKDECLYVGDGETDIQTANAAGLRCISALWGYRKKEYLQSFGQKEFAKDFEELKKYAF